MIAKLIALKSKVFRTELGASMVEYALLVMLIAIVALVAVSLAGDELSNTYSDINSGLEWARSQSN